jgi:hypothetical protein
MGARRNRKGSTGRGSLGFEEDQEEYIRESINGRVNIVVKAERKGSGGNEGVQSP